MFSLNLNCGNRIFELKLACDNPTIGQLGQEIAQLSGLQFDTLKIIGPKLKSSIIPAQNDNKLATTLGLHSGDKVMVLGSRASDVAAVMGARELPGLPSFEHEMLVAARRRRQHASAVVSRPPMAEYTFGEYRAWEYPGLSPAPPEALKLLYRLAADPGILAVMARYQWRVGRLTEMPPKGKVGISPVCVLGLNINAGTEIQLRLRTDDLRGFRKYASIRATLVHELTHNVWGNHDANFKALNSQLLKEVEAVAGTEGHLLLGPSAEAGDWLGEEAEALAKADVMVATAQLSGKSLRELAGAAAQPLLTRDARAAAAAAALKRFGTMPSTSGRGTDSGQGLHPAAGHGRLSSVTETVTTNVHVEASGMGVGMEGCAASGVENMEADLPQGVEAMDIDVEQHDWRGAGVTGVVQTVERVQVDAEQILDGHDDLQQYEHYDPQTAAAEAAVRHLEGFDDGSATPSNLPSSHIPQSLQDDVHAGIMKAKDDLPLYQSSSPRSPDLSIDRTSIAPGHSSVPAPHGDGLLEGPEQGGNVTSHHTRAISAESGLITTQLTSLPQESHLLSSGLSFPAPNLQLHNSQSSPSGIAGESVSKLELSIQNHDHSAHVPTTTPQNAKSPSSPPSFPSPSQELSASGPHPGSTSQSTLLPALLPPKEDMRNMEEYASTPSLGPCPLTTNPIIPQDDPSVEKISAAWVCLTCLVAAAANAARALLALDTLGTLLGNLAAHPEEERYQRIRLTNRTFEQRVGRDPVVLDLLSIAGFRVEGSGTDAVVVWRRHDPGLVWLVLSAVQAARDQLHRSRGHSQTSN